MNHNTGTASRFFFATAPLPCPYLPGRVERRLVTELVGNEAPAVHDTLSWAGFRRSHNIAYAPACPTCDACKAVRIVADRFTPSRTQRRIWSVNRDLLVAECPPQATDEQYALFADYQRSRHAGGDMEKMDVLDYQALVEDTAIQTTVVEFRDPTDTLVAACLMDRLTDGLSAVYSFFTPDAPKRSLGTHMILWMVERARDLGLEHVYLGFWIRDCAKMAYKDKFRPLEMYTPEGWVTLPEDPSEVA